MWISTDAMTQGQAAFSTTRIEDPKLIEELEQAGVKYSGEVVSRWLPEVLGWVVPILLLIGLWTFFFRRIADSTVLDAPLPYFAIATPGLTFARSVLGR